MKKVKMLIFLYFILTLVVQFILTGCDSSSDGGKNLPPVPLNEVDIVFISDNVANADAVAFKTYLDTVVKSVEIIDMTGIPSYDYTAVDLIIVDTPDVSWDSLYSDEAAAIYNSKKPVISLWEGQCLYASTPFDLFINDGQSASGTYRGVVVNNASDQVWSYPEDLVVTTGAKYIIYTAYSYVKEVYWADTTPAPPASAGTFGTPWSYSVAEDDYTDTDYSTMSYQVKNKVRYFHWGYSFAPDQMTDGGKRLFCNVVYWVVNGNN